MEPPCAGDKDSVSERPPMSLEINRQVFRNSKHTANYRGALANPIPFLTRKLKRRHSCEEVRHGPYAPLCTL